MKFTTTCFVRVKDTQKRKGLVDWLERIGYRYCIGYINARSAIDSPWIPYVGVSTRAETGFVECFVQCPDEGIDCGENIELFKALAALRDGDTLNQWYVCDVPYWCDLRQGDWVFRDTAANCPKGCSFGADGNIGCGAKARFIQKMTERSNYERD